jgi:vacuole morphology and inheritance protein 14
MISRHIKLAAHETNGSLYRVIQSLSLQIQHPTPLPTSTTASPNAALTLTSTSPPTALVRKDGENPDPLKDPLANEPEGSKGITTSASAANVGSLKIKPVSTVPTSEPVTPINFEFPASVKTKSRPSSPNVPTIQGTPRSAITADTVDEDAFDVAETVNVLTLQFLSDHAETRIAALEWLLMLHLKAPQKVRCAKSY